jgi:hypothetical protein
MKFFIIGLVLLGQGFMCHGADIVTAANYHGLIQGIGPGFFGHVGIGLPAGETCHGQPLVILLKTNPSYKETYAAMLTAEAAKQPVRMFNLGAQTTTFAPTYTYCTITEAGLGDFPNW